jgi:type VI secretion system secreted protein Hcp
MAFDIFLKIDSITGESTDDKHKNWIELFSFSHGVSQSGSGAISSAGARSAGKCDHQDFHITKRIDKSTPILMKHLCTGKHFEQAEVEICTNTGDKHCFMKYTFSHIVISSLNIGGGQGGAAFPTESTSFSYTKIKWEYFPIDPKNGSRGGAIPAHWDTHENKGG